MPRSIKAGTSKRKTRQCMYPNCDARPRSGRAYKFHLKDVHSIEDPKEWAKVEFERYMLGLPSIYGERK